jgi:hypothetical protein
VQLVPLHVVEHDTDHRRVDADHGRLELVDHGRVDNDL